MSKILHLEHFTLVKDEGNNRNGAKNEYNAFIHPHLGISDFPFFRILFPRNTKASQISFLCIFGHADV
jgi:hypothetical protein